MPVSVFASALEVIEAECRLDYLQLDEQPPFPGADSGHTIREYLGTPDRLVEHLLDHEILVVHGAPVTDAVLAASPALRLVCCARGGPVNIDLAAASARGVPVTTAPGKNADAVADLTLGFLVMLARRMRAAESFIQEGGALSSAFVGGQFLGRNLAGMTLGLVGLGKVGSCVADRAVAFGMSVLAYDPYLESDEIGRRGAEPVGLAELLARSDVVSLHARATSENENLFGAAEFMTMKRGALFVNTARETLVDEQALAAALACGQLGGAAVDVLRDHGDGRHPLLAFPNVVATPHIGGATQETLLLGARMVAEEIGRFVAGEPLRWAVNLDAICL